MQGSGPIFSWLARPLAGAIALCAWIGLGIHVEAQLARTGSLLQTLWILGGYFTVLTNLVVAVTFSVLALRGRYALNASAVSGVTIAILLVGVVYALLLQGLVELTAGAAVANVLLHMVTPILAPIYWLLCLRHGALHWRDPLIWAAFPLAYLVYGLLRGAAQGSFAYPFIDYVENGVPAVAITVAIITLCFLVAGYAMVWLDHRLAR